MPVFLDTNVLLYSISAAPAEAAKRDVARALLNRTDVVLSVQVLQEFHVQATRPGRAGALGHGASAAFIRVWKRFPIVENTLPLLDDALALSARGEFSFWDCMIIAAASSAGCQELLTEDMSHGRRIGELTIINPFS